MFVAFGSDEFVFQFSGSKLDNRNEHKLNAWPRWMLKTRAWKCNWLIFKWCDIVPLNIWSWTLNMFAAINNQQSENQRRQQNKQKNGFESIHPFQSKKSGSFFKIIHDRQMHGRTASANKFNWKKSSLLFSRCAACDRNLFLNWSNVFSVRSLFMSIMKGKKMEEKWEKCVTCASFGIEMKNGKEKINRKNYPAIALAALNETFVNWNRASNKLFLCSPNH